MKYRKKLFKRPEGDDFTRFVILDFTNMSAEVTLGTIKMNFTFRFEEGFYKFNETAGRFSQSMNGKFTGGMAIGTWWFFCGYGAKCLLRKK